MWIESLDVENLRGFQSATFTFQRGVNLIVGANGSGKSTALEAIVYALSPLVNSAFEREFPSAEVRTFLEARGKSHLGSSSWWGPDHTDMRSRDLVLRSSIRVHQQGLVLSSVCERNPGHEFKFPQWFLANAHRLPTFPNDWLPRPRAILAFANADRTSGARTTMDLSHNPDPEFPQQLRLLFAASSVSKSYHSTYTAFSNWFRAAEDLENQQKIERRDLDYADRSLTAVRRAIEGVLPEFSRLRVQRNPLHLVVDKAGRPYFLEQLSDGERTLVAMVADLAYRLAVVHDDLEDPLAGEAVFLIDEVELHLHPRLQRVLLPRLSRTFPNVQIIATTHSPQVLASVAADRVQVLDDFRVYRSQPTLGRDSNAILLEVFGVTARPDSEQRQLVEIEELIDRDEYAKARASLEQFASIVTERDHDVVRLRAMLSVLDAAQ